MLTTPPSPPLDHPLPADFLDVWARLLANLLRSLGPQPRTEVLRMLRSTFELTAADGVRVMDFGIANGYLLAEDEIVRAI